MHVHSAEAAGWMSALPTVKIVIFTTHIKTATIVIIIHNIEMHTLWHVTNEEHTRYIAWGLSSFGGVEKSPSSLDTSRLLNIPLHFFVQIFRFFLRRWWVYFPFGWHLKCEKLSFIRCPWTLPVTNVKTIAQFVNASDSFLKTVFMRIEFSNVWIFIEFDQSDNTILYLDSNDINYIDKVRPIKISYKSNRK